MASPALQQRWSLMRSTPRCEMRDFTWAGVCAAMRPRALWWSDRGGRCFAVSRERHMFSFPAAEGCGAAQWVRARVSRGRNRGTERLESLRAALGASCCDCRASTIRLATQALERYECVARSLEVVSVG
jgi:hypothetical protein